MRLKVDRVRMEKNLSIRDLAAKANVSKSYIQKIEAGEANPSIEVMCRIAKALGVTLNDLVSCDERRIL